MGTKAGLWIDHRKATIISLTGQGEQVETVVSDAERALRHREESPMRGAYEPRKVPASDSRRQAYRQRLDDYYDRVIDRVREAEAIVILGPGEAKGELRNRLERRRLLDRVVAVEPANRMTKRQAAARIRAFFPGECVRPRFLLRRTKGRLGAKTWTGVP